MATINYPLADGTTKEIKVTEEFKREYEKMLKEEERIERKETRRHISLDRLMELEEQQCSWGDLENKSLRRNQETFSFVSKELDPLEILIRQEESEEKPIVKALSLGLTDYQRKIAVEYYINNKTQTQIAEELGVARMSVCNILKKVKKKTLKNFV